MSDVKEVSYRCSADATHPTWSGIEGEVPTMCPECEAEGELVEVDENATGETGETGTTGETGESEEVEEGEEETAKYLVTGLVDIFDVQGNITGQYPVGSEQVLLVKRGDAAVESGNATRVE